MEIMFVSSLTPADERRVAVALLRLFGTTLDLLPIAYSIRVKTASGKTFTRTHACEDLSDAPVRELPEDAIRMLHLLERDQHGTV